MPQKVALIGFGVVGQGLIEILRNRGNSLRETLGFNVQIVAIADKMKGLNLYSRNDRT